MVNPKPITVGRVTTNSDAKVDDKTLDSNGRIPEELKEKARKMTEAAMITRFHLNLAKNKTGTHGIEAKA